VRKAASSAGCNLRGELRFINFNNKTAKMQSRLLADLLCVLIVIVTYTSIVSYLLVILIHLKDDGVTVTIAAWMADIANMHQPAIQRRARPEDAAMHITVSPGIPSNARR
jgi:hypothetical protein